MASFSSRLNRIILEQDLVQDLGQDPVVLVQMRKAANDMNRAADKAFEGLEDIKQILEASGQLENIAIKDMMAQILALTEGLKKGGGIRKSLEGLLALPIK